MPSLSIVTPWLDHPEFIEDYENAVRADDVEVIVIDNGSSAANAALIRAMVDRLGGKYIRNEENRWFSAANNQGLAASTAPIVLFLNNDISASSGWLDQVRRDVDETALFGPMVRQEQVNQSTLDYIEGSCIAATRDVWNRLSGWNERAFQMNHCEDVELCHRAVAAGLALRKTDWPLHHKGNGTGHTVPGTVAGALHNRQVLASLVRGEQVAINPSIAPQPPENYLKSGRLPDGERAYRLALQYQPNRADYWMDYAVILRASGRFEAAVEAFGRGMQLDSNLDLRGSNEIGITWSAAQKYDKAVGSFSRVVERMPASVPALCNLAAAQTRAGLVDEAIATAKQALQLDGSSGAAHVRLADALSAKGKPEEAVLVADAALRLDAKNAPAHCAMAAAYHAMGKTREAIEAYERALTIDPENIQIQFVKQMLDPEARLQ